MAILLYISLILLYLSQTHGFLDPINLVSIGAGIISSIGNLRCSFKECCSEVHIPADFDKLESTLSEKIYGQHLVQDVVSNALRAHWDKRGNKAPKPLTLSFHGWPGSGKNYVSKFIVESLYKEGFKSKFVHQFIGRIHFSSAHRVEEYKQNLYEWIKTNVSYCPRQLFIFDEVDKMPSGLLNALKPLIDYRDNLEGIDYRESIFIFLSNTGANLINEHFTEMWKTKGTKREHLKMSDFERLILMGAFNEEGGFHNSDTIKSNLIDHYVPFLPMERQHVKMCIIDEFKQRNISNPQQKHINEAMEFIEWDGPSEEKLFSKTGCKRISQKVGIIVTKNKYST